MDVNVKSIGDLFNSKNFYENEHVRKPFIPVLFLKTFRFHSEENLYLLGAVRTGGQIHEHAVLHMVSLTFQTFMKNFEEIIDAFIEEFTDQYVSFISGLRRIKPGSQEIFNYVEAHALARIFLARSHREKSIHFTMNIINLTRYSNMQGHDYQNCYHEELYLVGPAKYAVALQEHIQLSRKVTDISLRRNQALDDVQRLLAELGEKQERADKLRGRLEVLGSDLEGLQNTLLQEYEIDDLR